MSGEINNASQYVRARSERGVNAIDRQDRNFIHSKRAPGYRE